MVNFGSSKTYMLSRGQRKRERQTDRQAGRQATETDRDRQAEIVYPGEEFM